MLTSAWLAGADPAPPAAPPPMVPAAPAVVATGNGCGGCGDSCADACCGGHHRKHRLAGLGGKLKGRRHHNDCCEAAPTQCCAPAPKPVCCAPAPAPKPVCCSPAPAPCAPAANECCDDHQRKHRLAGLGGKLRHRHHHDECCDTGCGGCGTGAPGIAPVMPAPMPGAPGAEPKKMPTTIGSTPANRIEEGTRNPFELARRYEGKAQASPDYSKLTGQLFFVHTDGGRWVLRYAPISTEDKFGGSVILSREANLNAFREGDFVSIEGEVLAEKTNLRLGGALYRASKINLVERGQGSTAE
jgi:hypothetical protein